MSRNVQAVVIGGGVVGTAVLRELAQAGVDALLLRQLGRESEALALETQPE